MKVLIVYEVIPESLTIAQVDMSEEEYSFFSKAHNYCINADKWDEPKADIVNTISSALCTNKNYIAYMSEKKEIEYFMKWVNNILVDQTEIQATRLIKCGIML